MKVAGTNLHRKLWVKLNRLRTHQGRCNKCPFKWNEIDDPFCDFGVSEHSIFCPLRRFNGTFKELFHLRSKRAMIGLQL